MDRLKAMETFVRVVREGSFAAASDQLGLSRAIVTKHVMGLEKQLGARLINRTTRRFSVTEIGQTYFDFCVRVLQEMVEVGEDHYARGVEDLRGFSHEFHTAEGDDLAIEVAGAAGQFQAVSNGVS